MQPNEKPRTCILTPENFHTADDCTMHDHEEDVPKPRGVYGEWCRDPETCEGLGYCPRDPTCAD